MEIISKQELVEWMNSGGALKKKIAEASRLSICKVSAIANGREPMSLDAQYKLSAVMKHWENNKSAYRTSRKKSVPREVNRSLAILGEFYKATFMEAPSLYGKTKHGVMLFDFTIRAKMYKMWGKQSDLRLPDRQSVHAWKENLEKGKVGYEPAQLKRYKGKRCTNLMFI